MKEFSILSQLCIGLIAVCFASLFLTLRALMRSRNVYVYARRLLSAPANAADPPDVTTWDEVTFRDKLAFYNIWCGHAIRSPHVHAAQASEHGRTRCACGCGYCG